MPFWALGGGDSASDRSASEHGASDRGASDRGASDRGASDRGEWRRAPADFGRSKRAEAPGRAELDELLGRSGAAPERSAPERPAPERPAPERPAADLPRGSGPPLTSESDPVPRPGRHILSHHREISHLARDSRVPVWRRRLIIAVVIGAVFTIFTNWRIGLTLAVVAAIVDALIRSRAAAGNAAAGLTTGAQRSTKKELSKLDRSGFRALHIREIPGSDQVIDHLLIGPTGVYAIDSEEWDKRLPVRTRNGRQLWHGPYSQKERLQHACWEAAQATDLISNALGEEITVRPAMAVYGPAIPWGFATIREVDVFSGDKLRKYLRRHRAGQAMRLSPSDVVRIYTVADKVLPAKR